jgi:hypothetical protein
MSHLVSSGSFLLTWLRDLLCALGVLACIVALSAVTLHDFGDHYRPREIGRLAPHHVVLSQPDEVRGDKVRLISRIQAKVFLPTATAAQINPFRKFEPVPRPSLCRILLRLKLGLRSRSGEEPLGLSV